MSDIVDWLHEAYEQSDDEAHFLDVADEIERLRRRVVVLEMVITEEVDAYCCRDEANAMIVKDLMNRHRDGDVGEVPK